MTNAKLGHAERRLDRREQRRDKPNELSWVKKHIARIIARKIYNEIKPYIDMKSWRTTLGGAMGALGTYLMTLTDPAWMQMVGMVLNSCGLLIMGISSRDNKVTSEEAGAK